MTNFQNLKYFENIVISPSLKYQISQNRPTYSESYQFTVHFVVDADIDKQGDKFVSIKLCIDWWI